MRSSRSVFQLLSGTRPWAEWVASNAASGPDALAGSSARAGAASSKAQQAKVHPELITLTRLLRQGPRPSRPPAHPPEQTSIPQPRWQAAARWQCRRCNSPGWLGGWRPRWLAPPPRPNTTTKPTSTTPAPPPPQSKPQRQGQHRRPPQRPQASAQGIGHQPRRRHQVEQIALTVPTPPALEPPTQHRHDDRERHPSGDQPHAPHDHTQPRGHTGRHGVRSWVQTNQHTDERNRQHRLPAGENQVRERHSFEQHHPLTDADDLQLFYPKRVQYCRHCQKDYTKYHVCHGFS